MVRRTKEAGGSESGARNSAGGRMAGEERRRQIVKVAMRLFSERGFGGTTTKEIAQAAGVSEAIIFRHFATKEDLYRAIIDHKACAEHSDAEPHPIVEAIKCEVGDAVRRKDDRAVFEGLALAVMRHHEDDPEFLRLLLYSALEGHELAQMFWDRNVRVMYEFLGAYVRERQREGAFKGVEPPLVVRAFTGMAIHHTVTNALWDKQRTLLNLPSEMVARAFTDILLDGITSKPGKDSAKDSAPARKTAATQTKKKR